VTAAQSSDALDRGLYEFHIGRLTPFTSTVIITQQRALLLPLEPILAVTGVRLDSTVDAPKGVRFDGVTYLAGARVAALLAAELRVDSSSLVIEIRRGALFPAERERARASQACCSRGAHGVSDPRWTPRTGGGLVEWYMASTPADRTMYAEARVGVAVFGGALSAVGYAQNGAVAGAAAPSGGSWTYDFVNPTSSYIRDVRIGDLYGGVAATESFRGLQISNKLPFRTGYFDEIDFQPHLPPGWSYELYQNGRLIDVVDSPESAPPTRIPLTYGVTPLEVRAYGPSGQTVTTPLTLVTSSSQLPRGRVEYDAAAGRCSFTGCHDLAYATIDGGLTDALTLGGGAETWSDSTTRRWTPVARLSYATFTGWQMQADYQPAVLERALVSYIAPRLSASVQGGRSYAQIGAIGASSAIATISALSSQWFGSGSLAARTGRDDMSAWLPSATIVNAWLNGDSSRVASWDTGVQEVFRGVSMGARYSHAIGTSDITSLSATLLRPLDAGILRHIPVVSLGAGGGGGGRFVEGGATIELAARGTISLSGRSGLTRDRLSYATITYSAVLGAARVGAQMRSSTNAHTSTLINLSGAVVATADRALLVDPTISGNSAGVRGVAYYDDDDDGVFGPGDRPAAHVRIFVGGQAAVSDDRGRFRVWNVLPYQPIDVRVDSLVGLDPAFGLEPAQALRATPNMFNPVSVRLVRIFEVSGQVQLDGVSAPGGVRLVLESADGRFRFETLTYADGSYSFSRVYPSAYQLRVAPASLSALHAGADTRTLTVRPPAGGNEQTVMGPTLMLRTRQ